MTFFCLEKLPLSMIKSMAYAFVVIHLHSPIKLENAKNEERKVMPLSVSYCFNALIYDF